MKNLDAQYVFFHLNFLNVKGFLAQKFFNVLAIFHQFSDFKNGGQSHQTSISISWLPVSPNALELAVLRKANLISQ